MTKQQQIMVRKRSGDQAVFNPEKLALSLERAGAGQADIRDILNEIEKTMYSGISTHVIYKQAFRLLRKKSRPLAGRYKLKQAIMELGPTGYPFERFVGELLAFQGYEVQVGIVVEGHCVQHEVDVIAQKDDRHFMIECKFHNQGGRKCNVKVPLYILSRFNDVATQWKKMPKHANRFHQGWVVTNTQLTIDALQFGECMGLKLMSWDYPETGSLRQRIDMSGLHPITCLSGISKSEKQSLLDKGIVMCKKLCESDEHLKSIGIREQRIGKILEEARELCENKSK